MGNNISNEQIADRLEPAAEFVEGQDEYRVQSYRRAGSRIFALERPDSSACSSGSGAEAEPLKTLTGVPGLWRKLAEDICGQLGVKTLEELEVAAQDGGLARGWRA